MRTLLLCGLLPLFAQPLWAQDKPLSPQESLKRTTVPEGFRVRLYAAEPDVLNPIAMTLDDRGRLWVVESHSYPHWIKDGKPGKDRILIFEGQKEDGSFAKQAVFLDNGTNLSGITIGHGGVWLCALPNLLFIPLKPGEDKPAGPAEVKLDGFSLKLGHNTINNLHWGPDGWLYGCHGITDTSAIGVPGTPADKRVRMNCGVWRYHPLKKTFEPYAWGTTNPWGLDWDDYGEMFITNCVIKHIFHVVPGAHFVRMYGEDLNPHVFGLIESCADHVHWAGGHWGTSRGALGAHDEAGGGHAHAGCMVYLADTWPKEYRGQVFMGNIHGSRINMDRLEKKGSGYVSKRGFDIMKANDPWFRPLTILQAPDGNAYVSDWHDTGECHNYDKTYPSGRIYRLEYPTGVKAAPPDLARMSDLRLAWSQEHENDWFVRRTRLLLQERAAHGKLGPQVTRELRNLLKVEEDVRKKLRAMWALHGIGALKEEDLLQLTAKTDKGQEALRVWAVRLAGEDRKVSPAMRERLTELAEKDASPAVRLALASTLQRLPHEDRFMIGRKLMEHAADAKDLNLPLMIWYGLEPIAANDGEQAGLLLELGKIPLVRESISRRMAQAAGLPRLIGILDKTRDVELQKCVLRGMHEAFRGRRDLMMPALWEKSVQSALLSSADDEVREKAVHLSLIFGDTAMLASLRRQVEDKKGASDARRRSLEALVDFKADGLLPLLAALLGEKEMRSAALKALGRQSDPGVPAEILKRYATYTAAEKETAIATLSGRPPFALALLDAVDKKIVPRADISAFAARQIQALNDMKVSARLAEVWGVLRPTAGAKREQLREYLAIAAPDAVKKADRAKGHHLFTKHCASCHKLFGEGGAIGPDLTGSQRANPEYVLTKLLDPSAAVSKDYQMSLLMLEDGRTLTGIIKEETEKTLAVQTPTELIRVNKADIQTRKLTGLSIMPEGFLQTLTHAEIRDLVAYVGGEGPVK